MKKLLKILLLTVIATFLIAGSAMAFPFIEVVGYVNPYEATITDNGDGTSNIIDLQYVFTVADSMGGAQMKILSLEFENDVFTSVGNLQFVQPTNWTSFQMSSNESLYELMFAGIYVGLGDSLIFTVDVTMYNDALTDASYWGEGQVWAQSWCAMDTLQGVDGGSTSPVPEPATMLLLGTGLIGLAGLSRKRFKG